MTREVLVGASEAIQVLDADITCAAASDAKVLITGETGVGKEVVARLVHRRSTRSSGTLVTVNCAGIPDSLLESELFGHVRGSFTDAYRDKPGLLETASGGTVFLDEVGEMSARMQAVLLRFLETGELQRIGATRAHTRANVRMITATNRDLPTHIASGAFREDLYFRLNVIRIAVPPLRERASDVPLLVEHFADMFRRHHRLPEVQFTPAAMEALTAYSWPGNVRELKNVVERLVLKRIGEPLRLSDLPGEILGRAIPAAAAPPAERSLGDTLAEDMLVRGGSFWATVYPAFMAHDITRADLRRIVQIGLQSADGNYRTMIERFNMKPADYRRFLAFLRKHDCHLGLQRLRTPAARPESLRPLAADAPKVGAGRS